MRIKTFHSPAQQEPATARDPWSWAHKTWEDFAHDRHRQKTLVVLPVHGFNAASPTSPYDEAELAGHEWLQQGLPFIGKHIRVTVLPPLRFVLASAKEGLFGIDAETALMILREIALSVQHAGFAKLVFFNTSAINEPLLATAAIDLRAELGLRTYVVHACRHNLAASLPPLAVLLNEIAQHGERRKSNRCETLRPPHPSPSAAPLVRPLPPYRKYYLPALTPAQIAAIPNKEQTAIILPTAAIEQHGPHLPVCVDELIGEAILTNVISQYRGATPFYIAPPITYGKSNEHSAYPGTISLSATSLRRLIFAISSQLLKLGFRRLFVLNTHGGNSAVLAYALREMQETTPMWTKQLRPNGKSGLAEHESLWGFHAGEWETSLMLAYAPHLVRMDKAPCEYPVPLRAKGYLRPERTSLTFGWLTQDISKHGVMGNATTATSEKGKVWLAESGRNIAELIDNPLT